MQDEWAPPDAAAQGGLEQECHDYAGFVRRLIDAVRERRHIYDKKHVAYFNRVEREQAWQEIAELLGQSVDECQKRWKLLREKLFKELIKRDRILASGEDFHSDWACFERMNFIEHHIAVRKKHERFADQYIMRLVPEGHLQDSAGTQVTLKSEVVTAPTGSKLTGPRRYRRRKINYKQLYSSGQSSSIMTDADTSNASSGIKDEPTDLLEIEQRFDDTADSEVHDTDALKRHKQEEQPLQPTLRVRNFAISGSEARAAADDSDVLFGHLVTAMLKDIPAETFRDDAKLQVLQLLIHAKRNALKLAGGSQAPG